MVVLKAACGGFKGGFWWFSSSLLCWYCGPFVLFFAVPVLLCFRYDIVVVATFWAPSLLPERHCEVLWLLLLLRPVCLVSARWRLGHVFGGFRWCEEAKVLVVTVVVWCATVWWGGGLGCVVVVMRCEEDTEFGFWEMLFKSAVFRSTIGSLLLRRRTHSPCHKRPPFYELGCSSSRFMFMLLLVSWWGCFGGIVMQWQWWWCAVVMQWWCRLFNCGGGGDAWWGWWWWSVVGVMMYGGGSGACWGDFLWKQPLLHGSMFVVTSSSLCFLDGLGVYGVWRVRVTFCWACSFWFVCCLNFACHVFRLTCCVLVFGGPVHLASRPGVGV